MIRTLINWWSNRHLNRATRQLRSHVTATNAREGELLLTRDHMLAYIEHRLRARRLFREDRQKAARKGVETKRRARV